MAHNFYPKGAAPMYRSFLGWAVLLLSAGIAIAVTGDKPAGPKDAKKTDEATAAREGRAALLGSWQAGDGTLVRFENKRVVVFDREKQLHFYVAEYSDTDKPSQTPVVKLHSPLGDDGVIFRPEVKGDVLTIGLAGLLPTAQFRKLEAAPAELEVKPLTLGEAKTLSSEQVRTIKRELARRSKADQEVRHALDKDPSNPTKVEKARQTEKDNSAYLAGLLKEIGWIDVERFGTTSSERAMRIAQYSGDLSLLAAVLPCIEKDVKANRLFTGQTLYTKMVKAAAVEFFGEAAKKDTPPPAVEKQPEPEAEVAQADGGMLAVGSPAPKLTVQEFVKGKAVSKFEKGKVYVVELWATWCPPCLDSIPHLTELQKKYADITVIGVSVSDDPEKVKSFVEDMGDKMDYRVATDLDNAMAKNWLQAAGLNGIPTAFIVDKKGKIAWIGHPMEMDKPLEEIRSGK
jgi:thiol-disulfide isomerase/thioredoxin